MPNPMEIMGLIAGIKQMIDAPEQQQRQKDEQYLQYLTETGKQIGFTPDKVLSQHRFMSFNLVPVLRKSSRIEVFVRLSTYQINRLTLFIKLDAHSLCYFF